jgi:hypothetical protein
MGVSRTFGAVSLFGIGLLLMACEALDIYEGEHRPKAELAEIVADSHISGLLPVTILIRRVDAEDLGIRYRGARVLPGEHDLLIDCTVTESQRTSRHHLHVDVDAGVKYRVVANTGPGNRECTDVQLVAQY